MVTGSTPIFAVADVEATIRFYKEVLGFESSWVYGEPVTFGAASWGSVTVMFGCDPELSQRIEGHPHWIRVERVDDLHAKHTANSAEIVSPLEDKPWGFREYTVRDLNGYHLRFVGSPTHQSKGDGVFPERVEIVRRLPTPAEFSHVTDAAFGPDPNRIDSLERSWGGVVAIGPEGTALGVLRIMHDASGWFSVWDVAVLPEWQGKRIGSAIMEAALEEIHRESPGANVYLFTYKGGFYERLGFSQQSLHLRRV